MYSFVRQRISGVSEKTGSLSKTKSGKDIFTSHKCTNLKQNVRGVLTIYRRSLDSS